MPHTFVVKFLSAGKTLANRYSSSPIWSSYHIFISKKPTGLVYIYLEIKNPNQDSIVYRGTYYGLKKYNMNKLNNGVKPISY